VFHQIYRELVYRPGKTGPHRLCFNQIRREESAKKMMCEPNAASKQSVTQKHYSRSHDVVIRVYDDADNVIQTHERKGDLKEWLGPKMFVRRGQLRLQCFGNRRRNFGLHAENVF
jgi:hypothetical protein